MSTPTRGNPEDRRRRRLGDADLTPEQRAAAEARRADRQTPQYQEGLARDIDAYRREYPPVGDPELVAALAGLRRERERQGLSLTDMAERTGIDRATISKLETGKLANPTIGTLRTYARALGRRLAWTIETAEVGNS
jgi:ribosome-binding protein aMBF1 (putative translation factor)